MTLFLRPFCAVFLILINVILAYFWSFHLLVYQACLCTFTSMVYVVHIHTPGEFGVVYKAHLVKSMQQMPEIVAVKTLKGWR